MVNKIKTVLRKFHIPRTTVLLLVFFGLSAILVHKLFDLQIVEGETYANQLTTRTTKTRTIKSTRGNIYDRNGELLASNKLSYSLTLEDNGTYDSNRIKNLTLNSIAYQLIQIMRENGDQVNQEFHLVIDDQGNYAYDVTGITLQRFRADIYGRALIEDMKPEEAEATPEEMMAYLTGEDRFSIILTGDSAYTEEELEEYGLPKEISQDILMDMVKIRYGLSTKSFQKYVPVTIATDVSEETVATVMENKDVLQGVDIVQDSVRYYEDAMYFANIIGYTGKASAEELEELRQENPEYSTDSIIGKSGIEQYMEVDLQGTDGEETVYVDNLGKVLQIEEETRLDPIAGHDVYLTIDKDLQMAYYKILEQQIAGILVEHIIPAKFFDKTSVADASQVMVPVYDVYNALISNAVIDIRHFSSADASETEKNLYAKFQQKQTEVFGRITEEFTGSSPRAYKDLDQETQEYLDYIVNDLLMSSLGILDENAIDKTDPTYLAWEDEQSISLQEFLTYAARQNWIDITRIAPEGDYLDSKEVYASLGTYVTEYLISDTGFSKLLYKYMLLQDTVSGQEVLTVLYDQGILSKDDGMYESLLSGQITPYNFVISKISSLEITPGQLALDPCSGSIVVTNADDGQVLACVTYPGYDNNRLANNMDVEYYNKLVTDQAQPFYNKATQQTTAPGSTFKILSAIAGMGEGVIDENTYVNCTGSFDLVNPPINCWNHGGHGSLGIVSAIEQSCNYFFNYIGFELGKDKDGVFHEDLSLQRMATYADLINLDKKTGIELPEADPKVSDKMAVPTYMGQGTNLYTTVGLARYAATIANSGSSYRLSLIAKVTDSEGSILQEYEPTMESHVDLDEKSWGFIHEGMNRVIQTHKEFDSLGMAVAGKTGTAQQVTTRPDHGLFIGYAPYEAPEMAVAIRIPFGYSSGNACLVADKVFKYHFELDDRNKIVTGTASATSSTSND